MTLTTLSQISLGLGLLAYLFLTAFCVVTWARGITGRAALAASFMSLVYVLSLALTGFGPLSLSFETLSLLCWMVLLMRVIGVDLRRVGKPGPRPVEAVSWLALGLGGFAAAVPWVADPGTLAFWFAVGQLLLAICGLVLLEQVVRNTRDDLRWRLRYLNIGLGVLFTFQLVDQAMALMTGQHLSALVIIEPAVFALVVPFIAIASVRNRHNPLRLNLSRQFVFRTGTLIVTGSVLIALGTLGYLAQVLHGDWGTAVLAFVATLGVAGGLTVTGSSVARGWIRRFLQEHLFSNKFDYRDEWRRVTAQLTEPSLDYDLAQQVVRALGRVVGSLSGAVWQLSPDGLLIPLGQLHTSWNRPVSSCTSRTLREYFEQSDWVLDLEHLPFQAHRLVGRISDLQELPGIRYLIPLMTNNRLFGVAALTSPPAPTSLDWEDYDLLKLIARQASSFIALQSAERELADAEKLRSFHQVSAFVVHDVKTIVAQLALLTQNAAKHKSNPQFVDDMITTVGNAVDRMQRLLVQLRDGGESGSESIDLAATLEQTVRPLQDRLPAPGLVLPEKRIDVRGDPAKLRSAIGHVVQNAIDAANLHSEHIRSAPQVTVCLNDNGPWAEVVVEDNGPGMDARFIETTLFRPFATTKGVAGMGVGAYQARAYVRSLGGDISVDSRPGHGSRFTIRLPIETHD